MFCAFFFKCRFSHFAFSKEIQQETALALNMGQEQPSHGTNLALNMTQKQPLMVLRVTQFWRDLTVVCDKVVAGYWVIVSASRNFVC